MTIKGHEGLFRGKGSVLDSDCYIYMKIARRNINNLRYVDDITLMAESEEELKSLFFFLLYNIVLVLPYINMILPQVYTCSPS